MFIFCIFLSSCSQILLKKSASKIKIVKIDFYLNKYTIVGYSIFFIVIFISTYLYRFIPLSLGLMLDTLGYVFIAILSKIFFNESLNGLKLLGIGMIIVGVFICVV